MSDQPQMRTGPVATTPEGGPLAEGAPTTAPGAGQVRPTPEAGPLIPPTLRDHMQGPILGLDDVPAEKPSAPSPHPSPSAVEEGPGVRAHAGEAPAAREGDAHRETAQPSTTRTPQDDAELKKWPPYSGKPVSEVHWDDARRFAAPLVSQAEKLTIQAIDLSGRGLSKLARFLEQRRAARDGGDD